MKKLICLFLFVLPLSLLSALEIDGVTMPSNLEFSKKTLQLNGAGIREKFFMNLYVGGLYLQEKETDPETVLLKDEPMAIRLQITSGMITSKKMSKATLEGFKNSASLKMKVFETEIADFISAFEQKIQEGDIFEIVYLPRIGIQIHKNAEVLKTINCESSFKEAVFGIWLCEKPAQKSLKKAMLGMES